jgi:hypothetical protein
MQFNKLGETNYTILKNPPGKRSFGTDAKLSNSNKTLNQDSLVSPICVVEQKEKNGTMSILELAKVKGNEAVLIIAEKGIKRIRSNLPRDLETSTNEEKRMHSSLSYSLRRAVCSLGE